MSACSCEASIAHSGGVEPVSITVKQGIDRARATVRRWRATAKQRRELAILAEDTDFLKDIGVSQGDAMIEANKPFWKV